MDKKIDTSLIEFSNGEVVLCEIRKHPIGYVGIAIIGILIASFVFLVSYFAGGWISANLAEETELMPQIEQVAVIIGGVLSLLCLVMTVISMYLYGSDRIIATNQKVAQVLYKSIFSRKVSQLDIADVQDVTVTQDGILAHAFNYGTLVIETAGEQQNYTFTHTPEPVRFSKIIIDAHEKNVAQHGN